MSIKRLKSKNSLVKIIGNRKPQEFPLDQVIHCFLPLRRAKVIAQARQGYRELCEKIGSDKAEEMEARNWLKFTCFLSRPDGKNIVQDVYIMIGILASYVSRGKGQLLWWEPEKEETDVNA